MTNAPMAQSATMETAIDGEHLARVRDLSLRSLLVIPHAPLCTS